MLTYEEIIVLFVQARKQVKSKSNPNLRIEVHLLEQELHQFSKAKGTLRQIAFMSCEYYANEIKKNLYPEGS